MLVTLEYSVLLMELVTQFSRCASEMPVTFQRSLLNIIEIPWSEISRDPTKSSSHWCPLFQFRPHERS